MQNTQGNTLQHYIDVVDRTLQDSVSPEQKTNLAEMCYYDNLTTSECIDKCNSEY